MKQKIILKPTVIQSQYNFYFISFDQLSKYFSIVLNQYIQNHSIIQKVQSYQIISTLTVSSNNLINIDHISFILLYLEDSFFVAVQYKGNQLQDAIESIKSQESQFLSKWAQEKEIMEVEKNKKYELYSVFIQEQFLDYYSIARLQLLNSYLDQEITMEKQQVQFYIDVTKLNVSISNLGPIITVIQSIENLGRVFTQMKELPPGRYLIGYALTNAKEFQLSSVKYIIRNVVQIHQEDI